MITKNDEYFLSVAESESLTNAANALFISQSSLTKHIKSLEEQLGVDLFDHGTKPLRLTDAGKMYYRYLINEREKEATLLEEMREASEGKMGTLSLGVPVSLGELLLPRLLPSFHATYPRAKIRLTEAPGSSLQRLVAAKRLDIAFAFSTMPTDKLQSSILTKGAILLVTKKGKSISERYRDHKGPVILPLQPQMLTEFKYCLYRQGQLIEAAIDQFFRSIPFNPGILLRSSSPKVITSLIRRMDGLAAFLPSYIIPYLSEEETKELVFYRANTPALEWDLTAFYQNKNNLGPYETYLIRSVEAMQFGRLF